MSMHIFCKDAAPTAESIVAHIALNDVNATCGIVAPTGTDFSVCYGLVRRGANLNADIVYDKALQLVRLNEAGIAVPGVLKNCGMDTIDVNGINNDWYPMLARKRRHFKGKDIVWIPNANAFTRKIRKIRTSDFLVRYISKEREFRVHVLGGRWASISEKVNEEVDAIDPNVRGSLIWAHRYGWQHKLMGKCKLRGDVARIAIDATEVLDFQFGAVDVMLGVDGNLYVLEINSAPSLNERRVEKYANYFMSEYRSAQQ